MSTGGTVLVSVVAAVLASGICAIFVLSLASRRWAEMRAQVADELRLAWDRREALWAKRLNDQLASVARSAASTDATSAEEAQAGRVVTGLKTRLKEVEIRLAQSEEDWHAGDAGVRNWVTDVVKASGGEMQKYQQALASLRADVASLQGGNNWRAGDAALRAGVEAEVKAINADLRKQQSALSGLQQTLARMQLEPQGETLSPHEMHLYEQLVRRMEPVNYHPL